MRITHTHTHICLIIPLFQFLSTQRHSREFLLFFIFVFLALSLSLALMLTIKTMSLTASHLSLSICHVHIRFHIFMACCELFSLPSVLLSHVNSFGFLHLHPSSAVAYRCFSLAPSFDLASSPYLSYHVVVGYHQPVRGKGFQRDSNPQLLSMILPVALLLREALICWFLMNFAAWSSS